MGSHISTSTAHMRYGERENNSFPVSEKHVRLQTVQACRRVKLRLNRNTTSDLLLHKQTSKAVKPT